MNIEEFAKETDFISRFAADRWEHKYADVVDFVAKFEINNAVVFLQFEGETGKFTTVIHTDSSSNGTIRSHAADNAKDSYIGAMKKMQEAVESKKKELDVIQKFLRNKDILESML